MAPKKRQRKVDLDIVHFERKLIKLGGSYAITVPKEWVEEHGYQPGDVFSGMANSILTIGLRRDKVDPEDEGKDEGK